MRTTHAVFWSLMLTLWPLAGRAKGPPVAYHDADNLVIEVEKGTSVVVLDAEERVLAEGTSTDDGRFVLAGEQADPMLRLIRLIRDGKQEVYSLSECFPAVELRGALPTEVAPGLPLSTSVHVIPRSAKGGASGVGGISGVATLTCADAEVWRARVSVSPEGVLRSDSSDPIPMKLASDVRCTLAVRAAGARLETSVQVRAADSLALSTDRPIYRPGDQVYARALLLDRATSRPKADASVELRLLDEGGQVVAKKAIETSGYGVAAATLVVPKTAKGTALTLVALANGIESRRKLDLGQFKVEGLTVVLTMPPPVKAGDLAATALISVRAIRLDGGPAAKASAEIVVADAEPVRLTLDENGIGQVKVSVGANRGVVSVRARVETDGGRVGQAQSQLFVDDGTLSVYAVPESAQLVARLPNRIWTVVLDGQGEPVADVQIEADGVLGRTGPDGIAALTVTPGAKLIVKARLGTRKGERTLDAVDSGSLLELEAAVMDPGAPLRGRYRVPAGTEGVATVELIMEGSPVAAVTARLANGAAAFELAVPPLVRGTLIARGYHTVGGRVVMDTRLVFVTPPGDLVVTAKGDQDSYRPRQTATVAFAVRDGKGRPVVAAIGAAVVDAGLRSLGLEQPGIERAVSRLGKAWAPQAVPAPPWAKEALAAAADSVRLEILASAATAALPVPAFSETGPGRKTAAQGAFRAAIARRVTAIGKALTAFYKGQKAGRKAPADVQTLLVDGAYEADDLVDPWGRKTKVTLSTSCCEYSIRLVSAGLDGTFDSGDEVEAYASFDPRLRCPTRCAGGGLGMFGTGLGGGSFSSVAYGSARAMVGRLAEPPMREWFPDTLAVIPELVTDDQGNATWPVPLADNLTTWLLQARAVSRDGGLGSVELELAVNQPVSADVATEPELVLGDRIALPVELRNRTSAPLTLSVKISAEGALALAEDQEPTMRREVAPGVAVTERVWVVAQSVGAGQLSVEALAPDGQGDRLRRTVSVVGGGVPVEAAVAGEVLGGKNILASVASPKGGIPGTDRVLLRLYGTALGAVVEGLEGLLGMPSGCFEQTSSTTFPNALVLEYLQEKRVAKPDLTARAKGLLEAGWERLKAYEVPGGGFSWFGDAPANQVLTAFGLLEFRRMAPLVTIDAPTVDRTSAWLLGKRAANGSWAPDAEYLHADSWSSVQSGSLLVTSYITWALAHSAVGKGKAAILRSLAPSLRYLESHASEATGSYGAALVAVALSEGESTKASAARGRLAGMVKTDSKGAWLVESGSTATHSRGNGASIETTALGAMALLGGAETRALGEKCVDWLLAQRSPGAGWDSTQGTILALEAVLERDRLRSEAPVGRLVARAGDRELAVEAFDAASADVVRTLLLDSDEPSVQLAFEGTGRVQFQLGAEHEETVSASKSTPPLGVAVTLTGGTRQVGTAIAGTLTLTANEAVAMPIVTLELPAGVEVDKGLLESAGFAKVEVVGRRVALYGTRYESGTVVEVPLRLTPRRAGRLHGGPISGKPYYEPERAAYAVFPELLVE